MAFPQQPNIAPPLCTSKSLHIQITAIQICFLCREKKQSQGQPALPQWYQQQSSQHLVNFPTHFLISPKRTREASLHKVQPPNHWEILAQNTAPKTSSYFFHMHCHLRHCEKGLFNLSNQQQLLIQWRKLKYTYYKYHGYMPEA